MHDHRYPIGAKAHIKLHTIALLGTCNKGGEAVLSERCIVSSAMCEQERSLE